MPIPTRSQSSPPTCAPPLHGTPRRPDRPTDGDLVAAAAPLYAGGPLLPWQRLVADVALELIPDPTDPARLIYAYDQVVVVVGRRAGKTRVTHGVPVTRALIGADPTRPAAPMLAATTAQNATAAIRRLTETWDTFRSAAPRAVVDVCRLKRGVNHSAMELNYRRRVGGRWELRPDAGRLAVFAPTAAAVRGDAYQHVHVDEALTLTLDDGVDLLAAARPTIAEHNGRGQLWITSNEGKDGAGWLAALKADGRAAAAADAGTGTAYFEWAMPADADPTDPAVWRAAHPAVGWTLTESALARDLDVLGVDVFAREYLNYTPPADADRFAAAFDESLTLADPPTDVPVVFGVDVAADRSAASITAKAGDVIELVDRLPPDRVADRVRALYARHGPRWIAVDAIGAAGTVVDDLRRDPGIPLLILSARDVATACALYVDDVVAGRVRHRPAAALTEAAAAAVRRHIGDAGAWAWGRRSAGAPIDPLVAATWAHYASTRPAYESLTIPTR